MNQFDIHDSGLGRATIHPNLEHCGTAAWFVVAL